LDSVGVLQLTVNARSKVLPFNSAIPQWVIPTVPSPLVTDL
jgi:hypothetical protein